MRSTEGVLMTSLDALLDVLFSIAPVKLLSRSTIKEGQRREHQREREREREMVGKMNVR